jgi:hypothetical protein
VREGTDDPSIDEDHHFRYGSRTWSCSGAESAEGLLSESARKFTATGVVAWMDANIIEEVIKLDEGWMHGTGLASFQNFNVSLPMPQVFEKPLRGPMISMLAGDRYKSAQIRRIRDTDLLGQWMLVTSTAFFFWTGQIPTITSPRSSSPPEGETISDQLSAAMNAPFWY